MIFACLKFSFTVFSAEVPSITAIVTFGDSRSFHDLYLPASAPRITGMTVGFT